MIGIENSAKYRQHTGSMNRYRTSPVSKLLITEGAMDVAQSENSFWLFDMIGSYIPALNKVDDYFFVCILKSDPTEEEPERFEFKIQDDVPANKVHVRQEIEYSDFPSEGIRIYLSKIENGQYVAFLPSEY